MILTDIIALAKAGYSPKDIKDLIALAEPTPQAPGATDPEPEQKPEQEPAKKQEPENPSIEEPTKDLPAIDEKSNVIDYHEKVKELEAKIAEMQKENVSKDISGNETKSDDFLADLVRKYM